jgi:hypothetical protein
MSEWLTSIEDTYWLLAAVFALAVATFSVATITLIRESRGIAALGVVLLIASLLVLVGATGACEGHDRLAGSTYPCW